MYLLPKKTQLLERSRKFVMRKKEEEKHAARALFLRARKRRGKILQKTIVLVVEANVVLPVTDENEKTGEPSTRATRASKATRGSSMVLPERVQRPLPASSLRRRLVSQRIYFPLFSVAHSLLFHHTLVTDARADPAA